MPYNIFLFFYQVGARISSLWNPKAKKWLRGRKNLFKNLESAAIDLRGHTVIWFHCASLGEFEQGRPVMEQIRRHHPGTKIVVTFFSPSGYDIKKKFAGADLVCYLPFDSKRNAKRFMELIDPSLVIFVKYDLWYHILREVRHRNKHALLISAVFREGQSFFRWYGGFQRQMLRCFSRIFVQDETSLALLKHAGFHNASVSGDTRFDTVLQTAERFEAVPLVDNFCRDATVIVAGSTWAEDEQLIASAFESLAPAHGALRLIIAPHEINERHLRGIEQLFPDTTRYSRCSEAERITVRVLLIDNVGLLSRLYRYATICYVGGGFSKDGVHNVLEAAVYAKPVVFGSNYRKYREAAGLIAEGGGFAIHDEQDLTAKVKELLNDEGLINESGRKSEAYVRSNAGATGRIMAYIEENRLLTN